MSAAERAAEVLDKHRPVGPAEPQCRCGWREGFYPWAWRLHQAEALSAAGLLAEPTDQGETRTEWGVRWPDGGIRVALEPQIHEFPHRHLVYRRELRPGPWVEVPS